MAEECFALLCGGVDSPSVAPEPCGRSGRLSHELKFSIAFMLSELMQELIKLNKFDRRRPVLLAISTNHIYPVDDLIIKHDIMTHRVI